MLGHFIFSIRVSNPGKPAKGILFLQDNRHYKIECASFLCLWHAFFKCLYQLLCPLNSFCENKTGCLSHKLYLENRKYGEHFKIINPRALTYNPPARKSEQKRMSMKINDFILPYSNNSSTNNITIEFVFIFFSTRKQFLN